MAEAQTVAGTGEDNNDTGSQNNQINKHTKEGEVVKKKAEKGT